MEPLCHRPLDRATIRRGQAQLEIPDGGGPVKTFWISGFVLLAALGFMGTGKAQTSNAGLAPFTIKISTPKDSLKKGADAQVQISMTNTSDKDIYYSFGGGPVFDLEIQDAEGNKPSETPLGQRVHGESTQSSGGAVSAPEPIVLQTLGPGRTYTETFSLNKFYDLTKPGEYVIQAQRKDPQSAVLVKSNTIAITVNP